MRLSLVLLAAAVVCVPGALAADPGVSSDEIVIGGTAPISGPESAYAVVAQGAKAYFDYVNANGGVFGRDIRYVYLDDAYDPALTIQQTRRLVEQERVFAIFNVVGTEHTLATRPYLNQLGVPQLFVGSGAAALVRESAKYPWTMGYLPSFFAEGRFYGRHIAKTRANATIAVLYEDSDFGRDLLRGLRNGLRGKGKVVATQGYAVTEADVSSQIAALRASKANTLMLFALPKQTIQSFIAADKLGWRPKVTVAAVSIDPFVMEVARLNTNNRTTEGATSLAFLKDASNTAKWGKDAGREALLLDHEALQQGRRPEGRRQHVRDVGRPHDGGGAEEVRTQSDAEEAARRGHALDVRDEPVPAARHRGQDGAPETAIRSTRCSSTATRRASGARSARSFPRAESPARATFWALPSEGGT